MSHVPFTAPAYKEDAFNCVFCNAYANQFWSELSYYSAGRSMSLKNTDVSFCYRCNNFSLWYDQKLIYPDNSIVQLPNLDLREDIQDDYKEAASILQKSPRGAAALLRLALQKLCQQLGEEGKNINNDIGSLVKKGLPAKVQESLDSLRVIGNEAVHPGQIDLRDDINIAKSLFRLINFIAEKMISEPKQIDEIYAKIPEHKKEGILKRDEDDN